MNKIGIFGDSFAVPHVTSEWGESNMINTINWTRLLEAHGNHASGGTDLAWSFLKFEKYHSRYDQVIFVLTNTGGRITLEHCNRTINCTGKESSERAIKRLEKSNNYDLELHHIHSSLIDWQNMKTLKVFAERETFFCNLIVERIKQLRPDVKFIQAFAWNNIEHITANKYVPSTTPLVDISYYEDKIFGWRQDAKYIKRIKKYWLLANEPEDARVGHITTESHIILAGLIKEWLKTDEMFFDFDIKEFHNIKPDEKKYNTAYHKSYEDWLAYCEMNK